MNKKQRLEFKQLEHKLLSIEIQRWQQFTREASLAALTGILANTRLGLSDEEAALRSLTHARALVKIMKEEEEHI